VIGFFFEQPLLQRGRKVIGRRAHKQRGDEKHSDDERFGFHSFGKFRFYFDEFDPPQLSRFCKIGLPAHDQRREDSLIRVIG
jgi:hypothetical protein